MGTSSKEQFKKACERCGIEFTVYGRYKKRFCGSSCQSISNNLKNYNRAELGLNSGSAGALGEMTVCCDLIRRGYAVFRSISQSCLCDLVVVKNGKAILVEVTTGMKNPHNGKVIHPKKAGGKFELLGVVIHSDSSISYFWNDGIALISHTP